MMQTVYTLNDLTRKYKMSRWSIKYHATVGHIPPLRRAGYTLFYTADDMQTVDAFFTNRKRYSRIRAKKKRPKKVKVNRQDIGVWSKGDVQKALGIYACTMNMHILRGAIPAPSYQLGRIKVYTEKQFQELKNYFSDPNKYKRRK